MKTWFLCFGRTLELRGDVSDRVGRANVHRRTILKLFGCCCWIPYWYCSYWVPRGRRKPTSSVERPQQPKIRCRIFTLFFLRKSTEKSVLRRENVCTALLSRENGCLMVSILPMDHSSAMGVLHTLTISRKPNCLNRIWRLGTENGFTRHSDRNFHCYRF